MNIPPKNVHPSQTKSPLSMDSIKSEDHTFAGNSLKMKPKKDQVKSGPVNGSHQKQGETLEHNSEDNNSLKKDNITKKKLKTKKHKAGKTDTQNISVKSSFSKFDAIQKRNLIHVRSIDASKAQEKFSNAQSDVQQNCRLCNKAVYKMEEVKAEKNIYHKNCFRCHECNKQLKVDNYQSNEGVLYCTVHFKLLFVPKSVEDNGTVQLSKPELIIRENQPTELPPDVIRASDKPDLGLEELQQLDVRSRFKIFEEGQINRCDDQKSDVERNNGNVVRHNATVLSKVAKLQRTLSPNRHRSLSSQSENDDDDDDNEIDSDLEFDGLNDDCIRQRKREKRELPIGIGEAMNDIRTLFEKGHGIKKEERREERKLEIQNIRSRLFMGKQARIKEMYQQAVAESESAATDKKSNIDIEVDSKSLRERFEKGEVFRENQSGSENDADRCRKPTIEKEADVFESAISKKSRSIFMELDANVVIGKNQNILPSRSNSRDLHNKKAIGSVDNQLKSELDNDVVKCSEAVEDVKIETSELSEKFKFFEKYRPAENEKRVFRITPPREGVVKMPSPDENGNEDTKELSPDRNIIVHSGTTSMMLNKFRELEKYPNKYASNSPKPLKCFTPPPDGNRRLYTDQDSDEFASSDDEEEDEEESSLEEEDEDENGFHLPKDDEALREAQNAARAKQLRIKFEKWHANEIKREKAEEIDQRTNTVSDEKSIESTHSIRERFEKMRNDEKSPQPARPRYQVNRFV